MGSVIPFTMTFVFVKDIIVLYLQVGKGNHWAYFFERYHHSAYYEIKSVCSLIQVSFTT